MLPALFLASIVILQVYSQQPFSYYDGKLNSTTLSPRVIVDNSHKPGYSDILQQNTSSLHVWNFQTRTPVFNLTQSSLLTGKTADSGVPTVLVSNQKITLWNRTSSLDSLNINTSVVDGSRVLIMTDPEVAVFLMDASRLVVYRMASANYMYKDTNVSIDALTSGAICSDGDFFFGLAEQSANYYVADSSGRLYSSAQRYRVSAANASIMSTNWDCSILARADYSKNIAIALNLGQGIIEMPTLPVGSVLSTIKLNYDGSAMAVILQNGSILQFYKDTHYGSGGVGAASNCIWYYTGCVYNCSAIRYSTSTGTNLTCKCSSPTVWVSSAGACQRNCTADPNAAGASTNDSAICACQSGFQWNSLAEVCAINCNNISHAIQDSYVGPTVCFCETHYAWSGNQCLLNCSTIEGATGGVSQSGCGCSSGYSFYNSSFTCEIDCPVQTGYTGARVSRTECQCDSGYSWTSGSCKKKVALGLIIGVAAAGGLVLLGVVILVAWCCCCRVTNPMPHRPMPLNNSQAYMSSHRLNFHSNGMPMGPGGMPLGPGPSPMASAMPRKTMQNFGKTINEVVCSICLMGDTNIITSCKHRFHRECINLWMTKEKNCPNCRAENITVL